MICDLSLKKLVRIVRELVAPMLYNAQMYVLIPHLKCKALNTLVSVFLYNPMETIASNIIFITLLALFMLKTLRSVTSGNAVMERQV